jgi:nucleoside-diphosphate-sugar epimerase
MNEASMPGRVFLTGGSGYVGRNLIAHFVRHGVSVVALARSEQSADVVRALGALPHRADMLDPDLAAAMAGCDMLVHAAADTDHGAGSPTQQKHNEQGTRNVFGEARAAGIGKAIHISTESVLATGKPLVNVDETVALPRKPAGSYSRSKGAAETIALSFNRDDFAVVVLRPRFIWGRDDTTALPQLVQAVASKRFAWISGGMYRTDTTHIGNLCEAVVLALRKGRGGEVYFITDGEPMPFREFVCALLQTQGLAAPEKSVPRALLRVIAAAGDAVGNWSNGRIKAPLTLQSFATSAGEVTLNIAKARRDLGYVPVISRQEGLDDLRRRWLEQAV